MAWLFGSFLEDALKCVYVLNSLQEVWFSLSKKYNRESTTRKIDLQRRIQTTTKKNKYMAVYLSEIKNLWYRFLNGLRKEYEYTCILIENSMDSYPGICFEDVDFKLTRFDDKLQAYEWLLRSHHIIPSTLIEEVMLIVVVIIDDVIELEALILHKA